MICFFFFEEPCETQIVDCGIAYVHKFEKIPDIATNNVSFKHIYFSTPSNYRQQMEKAWKTIPKEKIKCIHPKPLSEHPGFPFHLGFANLDKEGATLETRVNAMIERGLKQDDGKVRICIVNAMSNAIGDHLIGMNAFGIWYEEITKLIPPERLEVTFFQLNPRRLASITKQWHPKFNHVYMLPNTMDKFCSCDGYYDLGGLLLQKGFGTQPMIDFFLDCLSIDKTKISPERKRIKYTLDPKAELEAVKLFRQLNAKNRPILLFHHLSTTPIRSMDAYQARKLVKEIIKKTDYTVVSCVPLDFKHKRFYSLHRMSRNLDEFAAIISKCDAIMSVDTSTYHIADAFDIPTIVFFSTIDPKYRTKYYPFVEGIMLEEPDGLLYGRHKNDTDNNDQKNKEIEYAKKLWRKINIDDALQKIECLKHPLAKGKH